jgi:hypothetical protein
VGYGREVFQSVRHRTKDLCLTPDRPDTGPSMIKRTLMVLFLAAGFTRTGQTYDVVKARRGLCEGVHNHYRCSQIVENEALKKFPNIAKRHDGQLTLYFAGKEIISFADSAEKKFTFEGLPGDIGYALIEVHYSEGSDFLLVHCRTGKTTRIKGIPTISPDHKKFVTTSGDEANFTETSLEIFDISGASPMLDTSVELQEEGAGWPANPRWIDNKTIEFSMDSPHGHETMHRIHRATNGWRLDSK